MKRKLIVVLVASALDLYAASLAQAGTCASSAVSLNNAATAVRTGPLNPTNGFPEYVTDSLGQSVQRCLDPVFCFASPVIPTDPFSIQIGSGIEAFYWGATNVVNTAAGNKVLTYVAAAETAFLRFGPNNEPIDGSQFPFLRLRFTMGVPVDGHYTVTHPYGTDTFDVVGATGARDIFFTVDKGLVSNATVQGAVGPFMKSVSAPVGFMGDGGVAAAPDLAGGAPCNVDAFGNNYVEVSGTDVNGLPVDFSGNGSGETLLHSDLWGIQGQVYDGKVQTPLNATRLTYSRSAAAGGQIDSFGTSTATAGLTVKDGPTIAAGTSRIPTALPLDHTIVGTQGENSRSVVIADASAVPAIVALTSADPTAVTPTDPTTLNLKLVDFVDITQADYDPATHILSVTAASGDARLNPTLTLRDYGNAFAAGNPTLTLTTVAPPASVSVDSAAGGSATAKVRVIAAAPPAAPTLLHSTAVTSRTVTLAWTDNATNESGFNIYSVVGATRTLVATVGANVSSAVVSGLNPASTNVFQVDAFNGVGAASSNQFTVTTLALPAAPTAAAAVLSPTVSRGINVTFTDNSTDETAFQVQRATVVAGTPGAFTTVGTINVAAPGTTGALSFTDTSGPPAVSTAYTYRILAVRGVDTSAPSANSATLTTPAAPTSNAAPTFGTVTANSVVVNWARRNTTETGYVVYRAPVVGGVVGAFAVVSGATPLGLVTTFTDSTVASNTTYQYRINAVGWSNYTTGVNGAVSANVTTTSLVTLNAPTNVAATNANTPVVSWTDQSTGETAYRVTRIPQTVNATTGLVTAGTPVTATSAAGALAGTGSNGSFTDTGATRDTTYKYSVSALNGATVGTAGTSAAFNLAATALAAANTPTLASGAANVAAVVTLTRYAPGAGLASVGGYEIQRCTVVAPARTCTNFAKVTGTAVNTAGTVDGSGTTTYRDTSVAHRTTYVYRVRTVGGAGTGFLGPFSATATVTTN